MAAWFYAHAVKLQKTSPHLMYSRPMSSLTNRDCMSLPWWENQAAMASMATNGMRGVAASNRPFHRRFDDQGIAAVRSGCVRQ